MTKKSPHSSLLSIFGSFKDYFVYTNYKYNLEDGSTITELPNNNVFG